MFGFELCVSHSASHCLPVCFRCRERSDKRFIVVGRRPVAMQPTEKRRSSDSVLCRFIRNRPSVCCVQGKAYRKRETYTSGKRVFGSAPCNVSFLWRCCVSHLRKLSPHSAVFRFELSVLDGALHGRARCTLLREHVNQRLVCAPDDLVECVMRHVAHQPVC